MRTPRLNKSHDGSTSPVGAAREPSPRQMLMQQVIQEIEELAMRTQKADEERRVCLETSRNLKGSIRIMGRVRPVLASEEKEPLCLNVLSRQQLEIMTEPRANLTEQSVRHRRRTTGGIQDSRSPSACRLSPLASPTCYGSPAATGSQPFLELKNFFFDDLFDAGATDDDVFASLCDEVTAAVDGESVSILAYGSTGSGKTHTVLNLANRVAQELQRQGEAMQQGGLDLKIQVEIVEIYNEQFRDLLAPEGSEPLKLKLSHTGTPTLQGAAHRDVTEGGPQALAANLEEVLKAGQAQRACSATAVHGGSSRSHLVMNMFIAVSDAASGALQRAGKISLVDLAGSERLKRSEAVGEQLREAQHINKSLSALADVISAKERRVSHVPYRNSKLTHLLQDVLGGQQNCRTVIIVALPPTLRDLSETLHSLQFSSRLTALSLPAVISRRSLSGGLDPNSRGLTASSCSLASPLASPSSRHHGLTDPLSGELQQQVEELQEELEEADRQLEGLRESLASKEAALEELRRDNAEKRTKKDAFEKSRSALLSSFSGLNQRLMEVEATAVQEQRSRHAASNASSTSTLCGTGGSRRISPPRPPVLQSRVIRCN
eukprot:TRINITY_DN13513_c0_g1_i1.p1 TRINITY_DN13513_c0_g1~~TRINITY_DN13513_c0_g1_i1.p1  ORF type:complete len:605 (-),score=109.51 TRINITY_DN13513_c0_g1_i1:229-2043(-)